MSGEAVTVAIGPCYGCGQRFGFNPEAVATVLVDPDTLLPPDLGGTPVERARREPLCPTCVATVRQVKANAGLPDPWPALP